MTASERLLKRAVSHLGPRFADYVVGDGNCATAPFLPPHRRRRAPPHPGAAQRHPAGTRGGRIPLFPVAARGGFPARRRLVKDWDADDFDPSETLDGSTVRVMRYRQHKRNGTIVQADWLTNFPIARLGVRSFFKLAKSRWEIENQGFNEAKNLYWMEDIQHHHPNSMLVNWLLLLLSFLIERLYRVRCRHRGAHPRLTAMQLTDTLWLHLTPTGPNTS